VMIH